MKKNLVLLFICFAKLTLAQEYTYQHYDWDKTPVIVKLSPDDEKELAVGLKEKRAIEYIYDAKGALSTYYTCHIIIRVNSADHLDDFNKISIPVDDLSSLEMIKARSISKEGKVIELSKADIKQAKNANDNSDYYYFAMEGLEAGSEVEYMYTVKVQSVFYGNEFMQAEFPQHDVEMEIISPPNLVFEGRSYNGFPDIKADSSLKPKNRLFVKAETVPTLKKEAYADYLSNLQRVEYTLAYNTTKGLGRVLDWSKAAEVFFYEYTETNPKVLKDVLKFAKKIDLKGAVTDREKLEALQNYIETNFSVKQVNDPDFEDVKKILVTHLANKNGIMRLTNALLKMFNYETQIVLTTDRTQMRFDGSFETWNYLGRALLYVPELDYYLAPTEFIYRNGLPPDDWIDNDGLFIRSSQVKNFSSVVATVKNISGPAHVTSFDNIYADVKFTGNFDSLNVHVKRVYTGYIAAFFQPIFEYLDDEHKNQLLDEQLKLMGDDSKLSNEKVSNKLKDNVEGHPFTVEADVSISSLIQSAGNKYLFNVGKIIGTQVELYNKDKRQCPVERPYNSSEQREITFNIPDGYKVSNLKDLGIRDSLIVNGVENCHFKSSYTVDGNKVKVTIDEQYSKGDLNIDQYDGFSKVINGAADFEKVVLVMEKI